jgi:hypothetical protein
LLIVAQLGSVACVFPSPRGFYQLNGTSKTAAMLLVDTPEVRRLLAEEDKREEEMNRFYREPHTQQERIQHMLDIMKHPEQYPPGRMEFLKAMSQMPGAFVAGGSYCDLIERSKSTCGPSDVYTTKYVLVQVKTGRGKGQRGWICETSAKRTFP